MKKHGSETEGRGEAQAILLSALKIARPWIEKAYRSVEPFGLSVSGPARDTLDQIDLAITFADANELPPMQAIPSPQSPPEPGRGGMLARQKRMAELEREIADWHRNIGRFNSSTQEEQNQFTRLTAELSRLCNEGGGGFESEHLRRFVPPISPETEELMDSLKAHYGVRTNTEVLKRTIQDARIPPSDLPAREAIERAAKALYEFDFGQESTNIEFPPWEEQTTGHLQERYRRRAAVAAAALQPLSQGNGEAVAWRYRFTSPEAYGTWFFTDEKIVADGKLERGAVVEPLYAAPPSQPEGVPLGEVRLALKTIFEYPISSASENMDAANMQAIAKRGLDHIRKAGLTTPSRGLIEAAEWQNKAAFDAAIEIAEICTESDPTIGEIKDIVLNALRTSAKGGAG